MDARKGLSRWTPAHRLTTAKLLLEKVVDRTRLLVALHENNAIVTYSTALAEQIPRSYAAHAFSLLQSTLLNQEIVLISSLWDKPDQSFDRHSIPTICALLDDTETRGEVTDEVANWHSPESVELVMRADTALSEDDQRNFLADYMKELSTEDVAAAEADLTYALDSCRSIEKSDLLRSVRNIRDKHVAHGLETTREEQRGPVAPMKYGDEKLLLEKSLPIVERLHRSVNGAGFEFSQAAQIHRKYAEEFWLNLKFDLTKKAAVKN